MKNWKIWAIAGGVLVMLMGAGVGAAELIKRIKILKPTSNVFETQQWVPVLGSITSTVKNRSADLYNRVINQFSVESNPRYAATSSSTWCNIFSRDVMLAMSVMLPQFFDGKELDANMMHDWLVKFGAPFGWRKATAAEAQKAANAGRPAIASWANPKPKGHGHFAVIRPGSLTEKGPSAAQAGKFNFNNKHIADGFGKIVPTYWVNA